MKNLRKGHFYADELFVDAADSYVSRVHLAFQASERDRVQAFHRAALAAGGLITRAITPPSRSTLTATMSKRCSTGTRLPGL